MATRTDKTAYALVDGRLLTGVSSRSFATAELCNTQTASPARVIHA
jgi:hypothetical protein